MAKIVWLRKICPVRLSLGSSRRGPVLITRGKMNIGCASMVLLVLFVSFMLVVDIVRINTGSMDLMMYQVLERLGPQENEGEEFDAVSVSVKQRFFSVVAQGPVQGETFCQFRQRVGKLALFYQGEPSTSSTGFSPGSDLSADHHQAERDQDVCVFPKMDPCDPQILPFDRSVPELNCSVKENWVYVRNGTFHMSPSVQEKQGKLLCEYAPIVRGRGDYTAVHASHIKPMLDGSPLLTDFFKVACLSASGRRYFNIHMGVAYNSTLMERAKTTPLPATALGGYDVFIFGFDSVSRMSWLRNLPRTREYFIKELGGIELEGHNIVGDGTVQALLPMLTGQTEQDLPSARRDQEMSGEVDTFPWIWKDFQKAGYVTAWGEDMSHIGTFQMRLNGFKQQPTDHYMRTYFLAAEPMYHRFLNGCVGSELRHIRFFNYFRDLYHMYKARRKFMFGFHSEFSHNDNNGLKVVDADFVKFLRELKTSGYLNHTILVLMADHGSRFSDIRLTQQGKLEERLPYFGFSFPAGFQAAYPEEVGHLRKNRKRLTTNFDVHETLHDLLDYNSPGGRKSRTKGRGVSLFKPIPVSRTCSQAGIEPHWCACLKWEDVSTSKDRALRLSTGKAVVDFLNGLTDFVRDRCEALALREVRALSRFVPTRDVLMFKKSADTHGDIPDLSDNMTLNFEYLQVNLLADPGPAHFEATVRHSLVTGDFTVRADDVSRTNMYGNASACVSESLPSLRPYCYCKHKKSKRRRWV